MDQADKCPSCEADLSPGFRFCPMCGHKPTTRLVCRNCQHENEATAKFCAGCGASLSSVVGGATEGPPLTDSLEPPPSAGISIEFPFSGSQTFEFAVDSASKLPGFRQFGHDKKVIYRVTLPPADLHLATDLVGFLKGWRSRTVYVDGEKAPWDSVFSYSWCLEKKGASFKPDEYCFGYGNDWGFNIWGCIQSHMAFSDREEWFCWGHWVGNSGDWEFDKQRIRHELQKNLHEYRFCPALDLTRLEEALAALPERVNPAKDKDWKFVEKWGDEPTPTLTVTVERYGYKEKTAMKSVAPNGYGAIREIAKRVRFRLPQPR
jgi:hypothetical protein